MPKITKKTTKLSRRNEFDIEDAASAVILAPAVGAVVVGTTGVAGKAAISFFAPAIATPVGGFGMFAATGALGYALYAFPGMLLKYCVDAAKSGENSLAKRHPKAMRAIHNTADLLLRVGCVAAAAAIIGSPVGATVICAMAIPVAIHLLQTLYTVMKCIVESLKSCLKPSIPKPAAKIEDPKKDGYVAVPTIAAPPRPGSIFASEPARSDDSKRNSAKETMHGDLWETAYVSF